MTKLRIVVSGFIGLYPSGGVTWDYIQYPLGLKALGHEVYYLEDTQQFPVFQTDDSKWDDCTATVQYLQQTMQSFGLQDNWAYRDVATGAWHGMSKTIVNSILSSADLFINVSSATDIKMPEYKSIPRRVLIDSDPMFTQVQYWDNENPARSYQSIKGIFNWYTHHFSFGENIGKPDCLIPTYDLKWIPTRQPIALSLWNTGNPSPARYGFSTIMNWSARTPMPYNGQLWGQKDVVFSGYKTLPIQFKKASFDIVVSCAIHAQEDFKKENFSQHGWNILAPDPLINSAEKYKAFIKSSKAEFSMAKETYVKSRSGWFSCRSACYLASGKPVAAQDTQWSEYLPHGKGLLAFTDMQTALHALDEINSNLPAHSKAAREIAHDQFDSHKVLTVMLDNIC